MARTIGRFRILEETSRVDSTVAYRGIDAAEQQVLIKTTPIGLNDAPTDWRAEFLTGLDAAKKILHPNVARVLEGGVDHELAFVVTEVVDGSSLSEWRNRTAPDLQTLLAVAIQLTEGLAAAHAQGVHHHALRPEVILVDDRAALKLTGFGVARPSISSDSSPMAGSISAHYRAPEQIYGQRLDERTDIFSLGVVLYEMFLRRRPFEGSSWIQITHKILNLAPPHLEETSAELPAPLPALLQRALSKNPRDRYRSPKEIGDLLGDLLARIRGTQPLHIDEDTDTLCEEATEPSMPQVQVAHLSIREGDNQRVVPLDKDEITLGRRGENDVSLIEEHVSRVHARIARELNGYALYDRDSRHGTFLNGERLNRRALLRDGDRIELGRGSRFRILFHEGAKPTTPPSTPPLASASLAKRDLELLLDVTAALNSSLSVDGVLNIIIDSALTITGAERGFIMLQEPDGEFTTRIRRHVDSAEPVPAEDAFSTGALQQCLRTRRPFLAHNIDELQDFSDRDSVVDLNLKSILCIPLVFRSQVLGVLYLDSQELKTPFRDSQLDLLLAFASQAAVSLENARLYEMAIIDPLTNVYRRHHFETRLHAEFQRAERYSSTLSLMFVDVDNFKRVNDNLGHPTGDVLLKAVAEIILGAARNTDLAARYGGDEFVLLAPETDLAMAEVLARRLAANLAHRRHSLVGQDVTLSLSIGVAAFPGESIVAPQQLLEAADKALLEAKRLGRNRVVCWPNVAARTKLVDPEPAR